MEKQISSATNADFKMLSDLGKASGIKKHGVFLVMGEKIISENRPFLQSNIVAEIRTAQLPQQFKMTEQWILSKELFNAIDSLGTHSNLVLLKTLEIPKANLDSQPDGLELIVPLGDPANLGALARSAWAFGITKMILTTESVTPFHPKAIKASSGAILKMKLIQAGALTEIKSENLWALDMHGPSIQTLDLPKNLRLILGEEGPGIGQLSSTVQKVSIPIQGIESLNATVAASIFIYQYKMNLTGKK